MRASVYVHVNKKKCTTLKLNRSFWAQNRNWSQSTYYLPVYNCKETKLHCLILTSQHPVFCILQLQLWSGTPWRQPAGDPTPPTHGKLPAGFKNIVFAKRIQRRWCRFHMIGLKKAIVIKTQTTHIKECSIYFVIGKITNNSCIVWRKCSYYIKKLLILIILINCCNVC